MFKRVAIVATLFLASVPVLAQRQMEYLDRGMIAINEGNGKVYVGWRLLANDAPNVAFNLYRQEGDAAPAKLNDRPIGDSTNFLDEHATLEKATRYFVKPVVNGNEADASASFNLDAKAPAQPFLSIPLDPPAGGTTPSGEKYTYSPGDASTADLDGDGQLDIVLKWEPSNGKDNSHGGYSGEVYLDGYKLNGQRLWRINLGKNIRAGAHYTQFQVYDYDGDGKAEVACKTSDGTIDGAGVVIGDEKADHRNPSGYILSGPEFLTIFDGPTGKALDTIPYNPPRHPTNGLNPTGDELKAVWGDGYGNRGDRFLAASAYLDGIHPSIVMCRGYYTRTNLWAVDFKGGKLQERWLFDSAASSNPRLYGGQGNHNLTVADVDGDGKDEIIYGAMCIDDNGKPLWSTGLGHGDAIHVGRFDPSIPDLMMFRIQERFDDAGDHMVNARTGEVLWRHPSTKAATSGGDKGEGPGRGCAADIDPRHPGSESWAFGAGMTGMYDAKGKKISEKAPRSCNMRIYWDADELDELLDGTAVQKWDPATSETNVIFDARNFDCVKINGTKSNPSLSADLFGDWREELVYPTSNGRELRVFSTTIPAKRRLVTLMEDPQYRMSICWQNTAYNQPPHVGFLMGPNMPEPKRPNVKIIAPKSVN